MFLVRASLAALFSAALVVTLGAPPAHASHIHRAPTSGQTHQTKTRKSARRTTHRRYRRHARRRGQRAIEPARVKEIQEALIKAHYLTGKPDGKWGDTTISAMRKYQADNGWQTKLMPDSRALVKLGLGPDYSNAINAKDLTLDTQPAGAPIPQDQEAGFAAASGVSQ